MCRHLLGSVSVLMLGLAWPRPAAAQVAPAIAAGAAAGAASGNTVKYGGSGSLVGEEPNDWLDPHTGSSSALARGCGVAAEVTLSVKPMSAYVGVMVQSESKELLAFEPGATVVVLANGVRRRLKTTVTGDEPIDPGWNLFTTLELPDKTELKGLSSLGVELLLKSRSFGPCRLNVSIARPAGPWRDETYTRYTTLEVNWGLGGRLATGAEHDLSPSMRPNLQLTFDFFFSLHHGATFDMTLDFYGARAARRATPNATFNGTPDLAATGFFLGYVGRLPLTDWLTLTWSPELGAVPFQISDDSKNKVRLTRAVICPRQRLRLMAPLIPIDGGALFAGLTLGHTYVPYGKLGEAPLTGNLLSALVTFGFGG